MKKIIMKSICIIIVFFLLVSYLNIVYGTDIKDLYGGDQNIASDDAGEKVTNIIAGILDILRLIGAAVAVTILMVIGAKYLVASAGDRADIKKYAFNYVIGAVIFFGASGILTIIKNIALH